MAKPDNNPDLLAKKTFLITMVGALLYIGVVFVFVIGGNRREEAREKAEAEAGQVHDSSGSAASEPEHKP